MCKQFEMLQFSTRPDNYKIILAKWQQKIVYINCCGKWRSIFFTKLRNDETEKLPWKERHLYRRDGALGAWTDQGNQEASKWTKWSQPASQLDSQLRSSFAALAVGLSTYHSKWSKRILGGNKFPVISKHIQTNVT